MNELQKELRLGNCLEKYGKIVTMNLSMIQKIINGSVIYKPIPLTKENIEKYIDWGFEKGFNKSVKDEEFWTTTEYIMENIIDGTSSFTIRITEYKEQLGEDFLRYLIDRQYLDFGLDDTLHNLQNLFFISSGQELPINKY